jgi:hypothetical protein
MIVKDNNTIGLVLLEEHEVLVEVDFEVNDELM